MRLAMEGVPMVALRELTGIEGASIVHSFSDLDPSRIIFSL